VESARAEITTVTNRETTRLILVFRLKAGMNDTFNQVVDNSNES
jgi:hypothetical protein